MWKYEQLNQLGLVCCYMQQAVRYLRFRFECQRLPYQLGRSYSHIQNELLRLH